jgi:leader peptidase (prepilin peptidase)/N-methyltransferase
MDWLWISFLLVLGACVGSFLNVVIYRLPRGQSIVFPGSHCPKCGRPIRWYDNIPIASWLILRGRCRFCKAAIAPRYLMVEAATAIRVGGLYAVYYMLRLRGQQAGELEQTWPMFAAHAALLCGLLVCSVVDIELWIVPLEVCWVVSVAGVAAATAAPHPFMPSVGSDAGLVALAAAVGLAVAWLLQRAGVLRPSFIAAEAPPASPKAAPDNQPAKGGKNKKGKPKKPAPQPPQPIKAQPAPPRRSVAALILLPLRALATFVSVILFGSPLSAPSEVTAAAMGKEHGVEPRKEVMREVLYLLPAVALATTAWLLLRNVAAVSAGWNWLTTAQGVGPAAAHINGFTAAVMGYLVGGAWVWGMRIFGTLAFGKEAMGLGDVHLMAMVGAVTGWIVPSMAFFVAPIFGLLWALYLAVRKGQRELPYGPWLALATLVVMVFYDWIVGLFGLYFTAVGL